MAKAPKNYSNIRFLSILAAALAASIVFVGSAMAQVAVTVGVSETYDTNIFLEDTIPFPPSLLPPDPEDPTKTIPAPINRDGEENDDFITNAYISFNYAPQLTKHLKTGMEFQVGALLFADSSDENRWTVDGTVRADAEQSMLPKPFAAHVSDTLSSGTSFASAEGTASSTAETNEVEASFGVADIELINRTPAGLSYTFIRHDFLGELLFSDRSGADALRDVEGADYYKHVLSLGITRNQSAHLDLYANLGAEYFDFINIEESGLEVSDPDSLDRLDYTADVGFTYIADEHFETGAFAGVTLTEFEEAQAPEDDSETSLRFGATATYTFSPQTSFDLGVDQSVETDLNGDRVLNRSAYAALNHVFNNRLMGNINGDFSQFDNTNDLTTSTDRFTLGAVLTFALAESISITGGYTYVNQDGGGSIVSFTDTSNDYESHRAFVAIEGGLVGTAP